MTKNRRLRRALRRELERKDVESTGSFRTHFVNLRVEMRGALEKPAPYLEQNERLVLWYIEQHHELALEHLRLRRK